MYLCFPLVSFFFLRRGEKNFRLQLTTFVKNFDTNGPGAVGTDMDQGITLMEHYGAQFALLEQQRQEFGKGEMTVPSFYSLC